MATFNFDRFDQEYETRELVQNLVSVIQEARRPDDANQRLIPADEGTPLHGLLARLRVGQEPVLEQFDFELGEILTIEAATNLCIAGGANPPEMFSTIANRVLFNAALDRQAPRWVHVSRSEAVDRHSEVQVLHFLNEKRTVVDWTLSLPELKLLAQSRLYTSAMMQNSLLHLVDTYCKDHKDYIRGMTPNQIANYLLSMEKNRDKTSYRREELKNLHRQVGQEYKAILVMAYTLIDRIFPADQPNLAAHRAIAQRTAILSYLPDELALPLAAKCQRAQDKCTPLTNEAVRRYAERMEEEQRVFLQHPLQYGRTIGAVPAAHHIQLNSMVAGAGPPTNHFGLPFVGYPNPYLNIFPAVLQPEDGGPRLYAPPAQMAAVGQPAAQQLGFPLPPVVAPGNAIAPQYLAALGLQGAQQQLAVQGQPMQAPLAAVGQPAGIQQAPPPQQPLANGQAGVAQLQADRGLEGVEFDPDQPPSQQQVMQMQMARAIANGQAARAARELAAANLARQQQTPIANYPLTGAASSLGSTQQSPAMPLRPPGDSGLNTPVLSSDGIAQARRNILADDGQNIDRRNILADDGPDIDILLEKLSSTPFSEVCDLLARGQIENTPKAKQRTDAIRAYADSMLTRSQARAAIPAPLVEGQVSLSSINLEQPITVEAATLMLIDALKEVKKLARMGADMNQKNPDHPSYKRGQVINGRYQSQERGQSDEGRSRERDRSQRDQSQGRYPSQNRDRSYRDQSRDRYQSNKDRSQGRESSRDRYQSSSGQRRDSRYPSEDRNRTKSDFQSRSRDGQDSRSYRDQSRDRSYPSSSSQSYNRTQSRSPARSNASSQYSSGNRPGRSLSRDRTSRSSSLNMREVYRSMRKGENCRLDYDPRKQKDCTKCTNPGHHEFECRKYSTLSTTKCSVCHKCYHLSAECKEKEKFPPNPGESSSKELGKN